MSKYMDRKRHERGSQPEIDVSEYLDREDPVEETDEKTFDQLMEELEKKLEPVRRLKDFDPEVLKTVQERVSSQGEKIDSHTEKLKEHGERLTKLEKDVADLTSSKPTLVAAASDVGVAHAEGVAKSIPVAVVEPTDEYSILYPKDPVPHHVSPAFYTRLSDGREILRYLEADAVRIANTEEFGISHQAIVVDAWADASGLLIRPLTPEESLRRRKMK